MTESRLGIIMHGVTGRMGMNQHLVRSILAIREQGGVLLSNGERVQVDPILVGRNAQKIEALAKEHSVERWTTDVDAALANQNDTVFFDAATTQMRAGLLKKAMDAGKHIYCEKPTAETLEDALELARYAKDRGLKNGVVHDKLYLPGLIKLRALRDSGFFGRILSVRVEFGYWVFEGDYRTAQRPSWNYRKDDGGGIVLDMLCHWRYVLDNTIAPVQSVNCLAVTHVDKRWDEQNQEYVADADDAAYATLELEGGVIAQLNSSWCTRVNREDLVTFHIDGTHGSAVAGLHGCKVQAREDTPKPVWNPDNPHGMDFYSGWTEYAGDEHYDNGFKIQWEAFIRHVVEDGPWEYDFLSGAKGVQLAELSYQSSLERRWLDVPELKV
jgi:predicted dehydrogenase